MDEAWAAGLKSLTDCQKSAKYCHQGLQDFVASTHNNFLQGQTDNGLFYGVNHSGESQLLKQEKVEFCTF